MSRVIKYRLWAKAEGYYLNAMTPAFGHALAAYLTGAMDSEEERTSFEDKLALEQFTGLLDRDGKEIYEGDIVEYFDWCYASDRRPNGRDPIKWWFEPFDKDYAHTDVYYPLVGMVTWDQVACTWAPTISSQDDFNESSFAYVCRKQEESVPMLNSLGLSNYPDPYYRVIGNLHENPDLLPKT